MVHPSSCWRLLFIFSNSWSSTANLSKLNEDYENGLFWHLIRSELRKLIRLFGLRGYADFGFRMARIAGYLGSCRKIASRRGRLFLPLYLGQGRRSTAIYQAGGRGVEPLSADPESVVLPLDEPPPFLPYKAAFFQRADFTTQGTHPSRFFFFAKFVYSWRSY